MLAFRRILDSFSSNACIVQEAISHVLSQFVIVVRIIFWLVVGYSD